MQCSCAAAEHFYLHRRTAEGALTQDKRRVRGAALAKAAGGWFRLLLISAKGRIAGGRQRESILSTPSKP